jgi:hypothetical protein
MRYELWKTVSKVVAEIDKNCYFSVAAETGQVDKYYWLKTAYEKT